MHLYVPAARGPSGRWGVFKVKLAHKYMIYNYKPEDLMLLALFIRKNNKN